MSVSVAHLRDGGAAWDLRLLPCPASPERIVLHTASPGEAQNSKFQVHFLLNACRFCTIIGLKIFTSNHLKSRTMCIAKGLRRKIINWYPGNIFTSCISKPQAFCNVLLSPFILSLSLSVTPTHLNSCHNASPLLMSLSLPQMSRDIVKTVQNFHTDFL